MNVDIVCDSDCVMSDSMFVCGSLLSDHVHILVSLFGSSLCTRKTSSGLSTITSSGHSAISLVFWSFLVSFTLVAERSVSRTSLFLVVE